MPPDTPLGNASLHWTAGCIPYVRTPTSRFDNLPGFPYSVHYANVDGLRMAYESVGPTHGQVVLMLHGEPTWSYLYRKMIPVLAGAGYRVITPDLIGLGRSDKPVQFSDYSYLAEVHWTEEFIEDRHLHDITAFLQDWGSLIGLRVVGDHPNWFARVIVANGELPNLPQGIKVVTLPDPPIPDPTLTLPFSTCASRTNAVPHVGVSECFAEWARYALVATAFRPSQVVQALIQSPISKAALAAYDAPYPTRAYMSGVRVFPSLIDTVGDPPTNMEAAEVLEHETKPFITIFGARDNTFTGAQQWFEDNVPGARGQDNYLYPTAGHFIQEDEGPNLARRVVAFMRANPLPAGASG